MCDRSYFVYGGIISQVKPNYRKTWQHGTTLITPNQEIDHLMRHREYKYNSTFFYVAKIPLEGSFYQFYHAIL